MIISKRKYLLWKSVRILYQSEDIREILKYAQSKFNYITLVSYTQIPEFEKHGFVLTEKNIANIYLDQSELEIFNKFSRATRNEIHKTEGIPDLKFVMDDKSPESIDATYNLYTKFEISQGRKPWSRDTITEGIKQFNAYYRGELISSIPCYDLAPEALQARAMFSKRLDKVDDQIYKIIGYATRRLVYELCLYAKRGGYKFVGLGAVTETTEQKKNVAQFKMFFGPRIEREYTYSKKAIFM